MKTKGTRKELLSTFDWFLIVFIILVVVAIGSDKIKQGSVRSATNKEASSHSHDGGDNFFDRVIRGRFFIREEKDHQDMTTPIPRGYEGYGKQILMVEKTEGFSVIEIADVEEQKYLVRFMTTTDQFPAVIKVSSGSGVFVSHEGKKILVMSKHQGVNLEELWGRIPYNTVKGIRHIDEEDITIVYPRDEEAWSMFHAMPLYDKEKFSNGVEVVGYPQQENKKSGRVEPLTNPRGNRAWEIALVRDNDSFPGLSGGAVLVDGSVATIATAVQYVGYRREWWTGKLIGPNPRIFARVVKQAIKDGPGREGMLVHKDVRDVPNMFHPPEKNYIPVMGEIVKVIRLHPDWDRESRVGCVGQEVQVVDSGAYYHEGWVTIRVNDTAETPCTYGQGGSTPLRGQFEPIKAKR